VSSDSDVEVVSDPVVEEGEWRTGKRRRAIGYRADDGRRRSGTPEETRKRFRDRETSVEEQQRSKEEEARWQIRLRQVHEAAAARWHARLKEAAEKERRLWEAPVEETWDLPLTRRYAAEEPSPGRKSEDVDEPCAPSPSRWFTNEAGDSDGGALLATPPWRPARPPTPLYAEPQRQEAQPQSE